MTKDQAAARAKEIAHKALLWTHASPDEHCYKELEQFIVDALMEASACVEVSEQKLGEYRSGKYTSGEIKAMIAEAFKRGAACKNEREQFLTLVNAVQVEMVKYMGRMGYHNEWPELNHARNLCATYLDERFNLQTEYLLEWQRIRDEIKRRGSEG